MQMELYYVVKVEQLSDNEKKATYVLGPFRSSDKAFDEKYDYESNNSHGYNLEVKKQIVNLEEDF